MNKLMIIISLIMSAQSYAGTYDTISEKTNLWLNAVSSKSEAYELGHDQLLEIKGLGEKELGSILRVIDSDFIRNSLEINGSKVTVEEFSPVAGEVLFKPIVTIHYQYDVNDNN